MNPHRARLQSERGSAIVFTLMMLVILTVVGIAASNRSNTELQVITSELQYHRNFNLAEGAAMEAFDLLEGIANPGIDPPVWLEPNNLMNEDNLSTYWAKPSTDPMHPQAAIVDPARTVFAASNEGVAAGNSLDMSKSTVHIYSLYGHSTSEGSTTIKIGYRKAF